MSYNKARAEKKWLKWKNAEEEQLRELGVDEEIIQRLHTYDWDVFKSDRRYYEKLSNTDLYPATDEKPRRICTVQELLDEIEDETLLSALRKEDEKTLQIVIWKLDGYTSEDISRKLKISANAVDSRMSRLKKKLKKYFYG
ncbi:MAG: sigma factor-like helix-turn-helix DNA-binding protein [Eubacteriales bacterium]|nr:sigma factor-like helix-turn-helix DNA-binding protein [Eubacteriales bacterium]